MEKLLNSIFEERQKQMHINFNIFEALNLRQKETIHSKFIGMLLNPNGMHGFGDAFLSSFLKIIGIEDPIRETSKKVELEKMVKFIHDPSINKGGNIDIAITGALNYPVYIENKIFAGDQPNQLLRYYHNSPNAKIIYLTLDGRHASNYTTGTEELFNKILPGREYKKYLENIKCISYEKEIHNWLCDCKKQIHGDCPLYNTIEQYIDVVKDLTGQTRSKEMEEKLIGIITRDKELLESYFTVRKINVDEVTKAIIWGKAVPLLEKYAEEHNLSFNITSDTDKNDCFSRGWGFEFSAKNGKAAIEFLFDENLKDLQYRVSGNNLKEDFEKMEYYQNWRNDEEVLALLCSGNNDVIGKIIEIIESHMDSN
jgi:hypothetical protein